VESGRPRDASVNIASPTEIHEGKKPEIITGPQGTKALVSVQSSGLEERHLFLPLVIVVGAHFLGIVPLFIFNHGIETVSLAE
jgi:glycosylphosphatidylinositol transamidase